MNKKLIIYAVIGAIVLNLGVSLFVYKEAEAAFVTITSAYSGSTNHNVGYPTLTASVTSGYKTGDAYLPGDKITITASQQWNTGCNNQNYNISASLYGIDSGTSIKSGTASYGGGCNGGGSWGSQTASISHTYTAPTTPGNYSIKAHSDTTHTHTCGPDSTTFSGSKSQDGYYYYTVYGPGACSSINGQSGMISSATKYCAVGKPSVTQKADVSNNSILKWTCSGYGGGESVGCSFTQQCPQYQYVSNGVCVPSPAACGPAGSGLSAVIGAPTPSTSAPTTNLCSVGYASTVSTGPSTFDWTCSNNNSTTVAGPSKNSIQLGPGSNSVKCSLPRVAGSNTLTGNGGGGTIIGPSNNNTCVQITNNTSVTPSLVATPSSKCTLNWNPSDSNGSGVCSLQSAITCKVDNGSFTPVSVSSSASISVGTHTLVCKDGSTQATSTVKCKLSPSYGEF